MNTQRLFSEKFCEIVCSLPDDLTSEDAFEAIFLQVLEDRALLNGLCWVLAEKWSEAFPGR